jgi:hypothetical protein
MWPSAALSGWLTEGLGGVRRVGVLDARVIEEMLCLKNMDGGEVIE